MTRTTSLVMTSLLLASLILPSSLSASPRGSGFYSTSLSCSSSGPLYYYVTGGPANTCGEIDTYRNGSWIFTGNWICTDASGNATKGPWYWSSTPSDQTDNPTFIRWPDGTATTTDWHIWDKTCPVISLGTLLGNPPPVYYGYATDAQWGAGLQRVYSKFLDSSSGLWWNPSTGNYTSGSSISVEGTLDHYSATYAAWSTAFPAQGVHQSGHHYAWTTCVSDGCCNSCWTTNFTP